MARNREFHDYIVHDLLSEISDVTSRGMFGGWGLYKDGIIFGIITDGELYFKVDESNVFEYERLDSHPFTFSKKKGQSVTLSYWLVPEEILENREKLYDLVEESVTVSKNLK